MILFALRNFIKNYTLTIPKIAPKEVFNKQINKTPLIF